MIKINLASSISSGSSISSLSGSTFLSADLIRKEAMKRLILILIGPLLLYIYEQQNVPSKQAQLNAKRQVLTELSNYNAKQAASVAEIKKFKEDEAVIETRISALEKIEKDRLREIRVLDLLQSIIPEKAWLTKIQINPEKLNIQGMAFSDYEVSSFLDSLTKSVFLMDVNLVSSNEVSVEGVNLKKFEINCLLERPQ